MFTKPDSTRSLVKAVIGNSLSHDLFSTLNKWEKESGVEWTVKRLKALNTAAKQLRAGNHSIVREIYQTESIAYHKGSLLPRQRAFKVIFNTIVTTQEPSVLKRHFAILRISTAYCLDQVSAGQIRDALDTITTPRVINEDVVEKLSRHIESLCRHAFGNQDDKIKPINLHRLKAFTSNYVGDNAARVGYDLPYGKAISSLCSTCFVPPSLEDKLPDSCHDFINLIRDGGADEEVTGRLVFLSEKGAKCRTIAVPNVWVQLLMEPVHTVLDSLIRLTHESVVHDQNRGAFFLKEHIELGSVVHCFDLSAATDVFPLRLQQALLRSLNLGEYAEALQDLTCQWQVKKDIETDDVSLVNYASGQPMGMYGSFPLFHLTHWALLKVLATVVGIPVNDQNAFRVLGDDVIIVNSRLAKAYQEAMSAIGVKISPTKSITSSEVGEFAGFLCIRTKKTTALFRPFKHGIQGTRAGVLNLVNAMGSKSRHVSQKWEKWYEVYRHTLSWRNPDLSPLIPNEDESGLLPKKIDSGRLRLLISQNLMRDPIMCSNLEYVLGDPLTQSEDWEEYLSELSVDLLDEEITGFDRVIGIDGSIPTTEFKSVEDQFYDDPLISSEMKKREEVPLGSTTVKRSSSFSR